jgi:hypothetical protein
VKVARKLGLSEEETEDIEQAALLHDVGKMGISDAVLGKPGPLDAGEWEEIKEHPKVGERIVASIESLAHLAPIVRAEHEWWNGQGYPDGLSGEEIPLASRIVLACDAFHAMTSDRPYRKAMRPEEAVEELEEGAGEQTIKVRQVTDVHSNWSSQGPMENGKFSYQLILDNGAEEALVMPTAEDGKLLRDLIHDADTIYWDTEREVLIFGKIA